jgi:hypothetical protein
MPNSYRSDRLWLLFFLYRTASGMGQQHQFTVDQDASRGDPERPDWASETNYRFGERLLAP